MQDIVRTRLIMFLSGVIIVPLVTVAVILFARGYRPNFQTKELKPTGLLVAHSYPEGAQVVVNGKTASATNTTLNLEPGDYVIEVKKDGFSTWSKNLIIQPEVVTRATATLFPTVPTLKQITSKGAANPSLSPDGSKVVFTSLDQKILYTLDLNESPLGLINREVKQLYQSTIPLTIQEWSPDSRNILINSNASLSAQLVIDISSGQMKSTDWSTWKETKNERLVQLFDTLPEILKNILATSSSTLDWSPRENKILYTATASATIPNNLKRQLPGSSSQPQNRNLEPGSIYVYDIEEDRNFKVGFNLPVTPTPKSNRKIAQLPQNVALHWLPTSSHLIKVETDKVTIFEYDSQNPFQVYTGPLTNSTVIPYPSAKQLLILANLTTTPTPDKPSVPNLYALTLR